MIDLGLSLLNIGIIGIAIGALTNRSKFLGSTFVNFSLLAIVASLDTFLTKVGLTSLPEGLVVFAYGYFIGTFVQKILRILPIPYIQEWALTIGG